MKIYQSTNCSYNNTFFRTKNQTSPNDQVKSKNVAFGNYSTHTPYELEYIDKAKKDLFFIMNASVPVQLKEQALDYLGKIADDKEVLSVLQTCIRSEKSDYDSSHLRIAAIKSLAKHNKSEKTHQFLCEVLKENYPKISNDDEENTFETLTEQISKYEAQEDIYLILPYLYCKNPNLVESTIHSIGQYDCPLSKRILFDFLKTEPKNYYPKFFGRTADILETLASSIAAQTLTPEEAELAKTKLKELAKQDKKIDYEDFCEYFIDEIGN